MSDYRKEFREAQREYYWTLPRAVFMALTGIVILCAIGFGLSYFGLLSHGFFAPQYEAIRRDVMIESRAYSEATTRRMYELKIQYDAAPNDDAKNTIRLLALHEARGFDKARLPRDLQLVLTQIGG